MPRYAVKTEVAVEKSKAEIEAAVSKYGATEYTSGWKPGAAMIGFRLNDLCIQFQLPIPDKTERRFTHKRDRHGYEKAVGTGAAEAAWEQERRSRWRALYLVVKAKLEAVECGISTLEQEFLAFVVLPGTGLTIGEWMIDRMMPEIRAGQTPLALAAHREPPPPPRIVQLNDTGS